MLYRSAFIVPALLATAAMAQPAAQAPAQPPAKRTILQTADVAASPAQETLFGTVEIAPGSGNAFHTHNAARSAMSRKAISGWK